jgi:hypothetical protein
MERFREAIAAQAQTNQVAQRSRQEIALEEELKRDLDEMVEARRAHQADSAVPVPHVVEFGTLGELVVHPPIVDKVKQLMGAYGNGETACAMHHIHANRQLPGTGSSNWHQVRGCSLCRAASYAVGLNRSDGGGDADRYAGL